MKDYISNPAFVVENEYERAALIQYLNRTMKCEYEESVYPPDGPRVNSEHRYIITAYADFTLEDLCLLYCAL